MSNKTATFRTTIAYTDEDGRDQDKVNSVNVLYSSSARGELDVADEAAADTVFTVPVGSIEAVTGVWIRNDTGQDLELSINESAALQSLKTGGIIFLSDADASATPIASITLTLTAEQDGAGKIKYAVFGDPE